MNLLPTESMKSSVQESIVRWFDTNGRNLPWRTTSDPYEVLIAEMLLRRTTATAVARVYSAFIGRFEKPEQLARASVRTIASMVGTLGLQNLRARHLRQTAVHIVKEFRGSIPDTMERLVDLPGVGAYVASAVLNFAFCRPSPLVDGNTIHLLSRLFELEFAGPADRSAWDFIASFELGNQNKAFYWGIIDLVAMVCLRRAPRCETCPLHEPCLWRQKNRPAFKTG